MENEENKTKELIRIGLGAVLFIVSILLKMPLLTMASYLILGIKVIINAFKNIISGTLFDENFLMTIATVGAICLGDYNEAVMVMLLYCLGEFAQDAVEDKSVENITSLMDIEPETARLIKEGKELSVTPEEVKTNDLIKVLPGEKVPLDGTVIKGHCFADTKAITGESIPKEYSEGQTILSGSIVSDSPIIIKVTGEYSQSTVGKIIKLVKESENNKAPTERFITRFAKIYTPCVCAAALLTALIPSLITGNWSVWIHRALTFLVISCPCALVLSVPLAFFAAIGFSASKGILVKGGTELEKLAEANTFVFDKTGTLTEGTFTITEIEGDRNKVLSLAFALEKSSTHPIAKAICKYCETNKIQPAEVNEVKEVPGLGIEGKTKGKTVLLGNLKMMEKYGILLIPDSESFIDRVYVSSDKILIGTITISDTIKSNAEKALKSLKNLGVQSTIILSGDSQSITQSVALQVGADGFKASLLPHQKVEELRKLQEKSVCVYVGDGINDAPVIATADVGIAMGGIGSDAAIEAGGIVITTDNLEKLPVVFKTASKCVKIAKQNVFLALSVKAICLALSFIIPSSMALAVFADTGVALMCVFNSMRTLSNN